jgi:hypothetical protein
MGLVAKIDQTVQQPCSSLQLQLCYSVGWTAQRNSTKSIKFITFLLPHTTAGQRKSYSRKAQSIQPCVCCCGGRRGDQETNSNSAHGRTASASLTLITTTACARRPHNLLPCISCTNAVHSLFGCIYALRARIISAVIVVSAPERTDFTERPNCLLCGWRY